MNPLQKINLNLASYALIFLIVLPIFGFNFFLHFIGNILLLLFLVPILIILFLLISFNSLKSRIRTCNQCGTISLSVDNTCANCGAKFVDVKTKDSEEYNNPSETTIEVNAEEIK